MNRLWPWARTSDKDKNPPPPIQPKRDRSPESRSSSSTEQRKRKRSRSPPPPPRSVPLSPPASSSSSESASSSSSSLSPESMEPTFEPFPPLPLPSPPYPSTLLPAPTSMYSSSISLSLGSLPHSAFSPSMPSSLRALSTHSLPFPNTPTDMQDVLTILQRNVVRFFRVMPGTGMTMQPHPHRGQLTIFYAVTNQGQQAIFRITVVQAINYSLLSQFMMQNVILVRNLAIDLVHGYIDIWIDLHPALVNQVQSARLLLRPPPSTTTTNSMTFPDTFSSSSPSYQDKMSYQMTLEQSYTVSNTLQCVLPPLPLLIHCGYKNAQGPTVEATFQSDPTFPQHQAPSWTPAFYDSGGSLSGSKPGGTSARLSSSSFSSGPSGPSSSSSSSPSSLVPSGHLHNKTRLSFADIWASTQDGGASFQPWKVQCIQDPIRTEDRKTVRPLSEPLLSTLIQDMSLDCAPWMTRSPSSSIVTIDMSPSDMEHLFDLALTLKRLHTLLTQETKTPPREMQPSRRNTVASSPLTLNIVARHNYPFPNQMCYYVMCYGLPSIRVTEMSYLLQQLGTRRRNITLDLSKNVRCVCIQWMSSQSLSFTQLGASYLWRGPVHHLSAGTNKTRSTQGPGPRGLWEEAEPKGKGASGKVGSAEKDLAEWVGDRAPSQYEFVELRNVLVED